MLEESKEDLISCVHLNSKDEPFGLNIDKLSSTYLEYFPTAYQEDSGFYFQYSIRGVWVKKSLLEITKHFKKIVNSLYPYFWKNSFSSELEGILPLNCTAVEKFKKATNYINLLNGLFSLTTFELEPHRKEIFSTTQLNFSYDPDAKCPKFDRFLDDVFLGNERLKMRLSEAFGYGLTTLTEAQVFFIFYSPGSSGKSVASRLFIRLAGGKEQVSTVALADLSKKFQRSQLWGKLANVSTENQQNGRQKFNTQALKAITSGDLIQLEFKGKNPFTDIITAKLFFSVNELPIPDDKTFAYMRRVVLIPFLAQFLDKPDKTKKEEKKRNPHMEKELARELPGLFNFSMEGLQRLMKNKFQFTPSKVAQKVLAKYVSDINPICNFVSETLEVNKKSEVTQDSLYAAYTTWARKNGERVDNKRSFLKDLRQNLNNAKIPFKERKSNSKRFFTGIALKNPSNLSIDEI